MQKPFLLTPEQTMRSGLTWLDWEALMKCLPLLLDPASREPQDSPLLRKTLKDKEISLLIWARVGGHLIPYRGVPPTRFHEIPYAKIPRGTLKVIQDIILGNPKIIAKIISTRKLRKLILDEEPLFLSKVIFTNDAVAVLRSLFYTYPSSTEGKKVEKIEKSPNRGRILAHFRNEIRGANEHDYRDVLSECQDLLLLKYPTFDPLIGPFEPWFFSCIVKSAVQKYRKVLKKDPRLSSLTALAARSLTSQPEPEVDPGLDEILKIFEQLRSEALQGTLSEKDLPCRLREELSSAGFEVANEPSPQEQQKREAKRHLRILSNQIFGRRLLVVRRREIEEKSYFEIAEELGITKDIARQDHCQCKRKMSEILSFYIAYTEFTPGTPDSTI